jgi:protease-4
MLRGFINALNATYLMHPAYAEHLAAIVWLVRQGQLDFASISSEVVQSARPYILDHERGKLSVTSLEGPLFRDDDFCGGPGMISVSNQLKKFDQDRDIDAHLLIMHTPGGQVQGTEILANTVVNTEKPVVVFGEDVFSGGVYIASGASSIVLSGKNARMGSIGVQFRYDSFKRKFEKEGIDSIVIKATKSQDKNSYNLEDPSEEDKKRFAKEVLDPLDENFMDHVRTHRPGIDESVLTGREYFAEDAIRLGLADHIGTIESAIELAFDMAGKPQSQISSSKTYFNMSQENNPTQNHAETNPSVTSEQNPAPVQEITPEAQELQALRKRNEVLEQMVASKDRVITVHLQTIDAQASVITQLKTENQRLAQLPASDPEAEVTAPSGDVKAPEKPAGAPLPPEIQAAIEDGQKRRARHIKNGIIKE